MKFTTIFQSLTVILLITMYLTNPTPEDYKAWAKDQIVAQGESTLEKGVISLVGGITLDKLTTSKDYYFLSMHTTYYGDSEFKTIGLLSEFILLSDITDLINGDGKESSESRGGGS